MTPTLKKTQSQKTFEEPEHVLTLEEIEERFTLEDLQLLVDSYRDETEDLGDAKLSIVNGCIALTVIDKPENGLGVYYAENNDDLFQLIDEKYLALIASDRSVYNDFWDRWTSVIDALTPCRIIDETFFE